LLIQIESHLTNAEHSNETSIMSILMISQWWKQNLG